MPIHASGLLDHPFTGAIQKTVVLLVGLGRTGHGASAQMDSSLPLPTKAMHVDHSGAKVARSSASAS